MKIFWLFATCLLAIVGILAAQDPNPQLYVLKAEDVVQVRIAKEPALSGSFLIRTDGKITLPLLGVQTVAGLTTTELRQKLEGAWSEILGRPVSVAVIVMKVSETKKAN